MVATVKGEGYSWVGMNRTECGNDAGFVHTYLMCLPFANRFLFFSIPNFL